MQRTFVSSSVFFFFLYCVTHCGVKLTMKGCSLSGINFLPTVATGARSKEAVIDQKKRKGGGGVSRLFKHSKLVFWLGMMLESLPRPPSNPVSCRDWRMCLILGSETLKTFEGPPNWPHPQMRRISERALMLSSLWTDVSGKSFDCVKVW